MKGLTGPTLFKGQKCKFHLMMESGESFLNKHLNILDIGKEIRFFNSAETCCSCVLQSKQVTDKQHDISQWWGFQESRVNRFVLKFRC